VEQRERRRLRGLAQAVRLAQEVRADRRAENALEKTIRARGAKIERGKGLHRELRVDVDHDRYDLCGRVAAERQVAAELLHVRLAPLDDQRLERIDELLLVAAREKEVILLRRLVRHEQRLERVEL